MQTGRPVRSRAAPIPSRKRRRTRPVATRGHEKRAFRKIDVAAARIESLIDRLLDLPLLSAGDLVLQPEDVDLKALVEHVVSHLSDETGHGSDISIHAPEGVVGRWDRMRLEQVIANLLSNAIKCGKGEPIDITVSTEADRVRLFVRDHGVGIDSSEQERIFERFERLTPVSHSGGFGIGLWVVREIIEAHGGHVTVSSHPDEGSEFAVELPRWPSHEKSEQTSKPEPSLHHEVHS